MTGKCITSSIPIQGKPTLKHILYVNIAVLIFLNPNDACSQSFFRHNGGVVTHDDRTLPERFDDEEQLLWRQDLLPGLSTPCACDGLIFLTTYQEAGGELATVALDQMTGEVRWKRVLRPDTIEPFHSTGSPASSSVACDGERVYVFFGSHGLLCYDMTGTLLWSKTMGPFQDEFGAASSPILVDGKVILNEDHDLDSFLIAIDQQTGETVWQVDRSEFTRSYATPVLWSHGDTDEIVVAGPLRLVAYDATDGSQRWWVNGLSRLVDSTPAVSAGHLFLATWSMGGDQQDRISIEPFAEALEQFDRDANGKIGRSELTDGPVLLRFFRIDLNGDEELDQEEWNRQARIFELAENVAMAVRPGGSGDVTQTHVKWTYRRGLPVVPSPLVYRNVFYMIKNGGILTSLDAATGKRIKRGRVGHAGNYYASLVAGDGKLYTASEQGEMTVVRAAGRWQVISTHDFGERILATPAIDDGKLFVRTSSALYCFASK